MFEVEVKIGVSRFSKEKLLVKRSGKKQKIGDEKWKITVEKVTVQDEKKKKWERNRYKWRKEDGM